MLGKELSHREPQEKGEPALSDVTMPVTGGCQCGFVRYELTGKPLPVVICHCKECQKQTSSAFGMTLPAFRRDFKLSSGTLKEWRRLADSGREVVCYFCPDCGTTVHYRIDTQPGVIAIPVGAFADPSFPPPFQSFYHDSWRCEWIEINAEPLATFD